MADLKETAGKIGTGIKEAVVKVEKAGEQAVQWEKEHFPGQVAAVKGAVKKAEEAGAKAVKWEKEHLPEQVKAIKASAVALEEGVERAKESIHEKALLAQARQLQQMRLERLRLEGQVALEELKVKETILLAKSRKALGARPTGLGGIFKPQNVWGKTPEKPTQFKAAAPKVNIWTNKPISTVRVFGKAPKTYAKHKSQPKRNVWTRVPIVSIVKKPLYKAKVTRNVWSNKPIRRR
jgi:hypothetical protein